MIMLCSKCGTRFESLIVDRELAWKELYTTSAKHIQHRHKGMFEEMQKAVMISITSLTTFMHVSEFCTIPEEEVILQAIVEKAQDIVMAAIGFDPEDDEDDVIEDDEDSIENDPQVGTVEVVTEEDKLVPVTEPVVTPFTSDIGV